MIPPKYAIIHHSLTADSGTVSWSAIREYHIKTNGWKDIGYHYGIELVGPYYEVLIGRPTDVAGAHCMGRNGDSVGICFVGNFDLAPPPDAMMKRAVVVLSPIINQLKIPSERIEPHSGYSSKTCPGKMFPMKEFVKALRVGVWK